MYDENGPYDWWLVEQKGATLSLSKCAAAISSRTSVSSKKPKNRYQARLWEHSTPQSRLSQSQEATCTAASF